MKTAEEILKDTFRDCGGYLDPSTRRAALVAMREFASQREPVVGGKDLSEITDEDAEEMLKVDCLKGYDYLNRHLIKEIIKTHIDIIKRGDGRARTVDFLRSKGYDIPNKHK